MIILSAAVLAAACDDLSKSQNFDGAAHASPYSDWGARTWSMPDGQAQLFVPSRGTRTMLPEIRAGLQHGKAGLQLRWHLDQAPN